MTWRNKWISNSSKMQPLYWFHVLQPKSVYDFAFALKTAHSWRTDDTMENEPAYLFSRGQYATHSDACGSIFLDDRATRLSDAGQQRTEQCRHQTYLITACMHARRQARRQLTASASPRINSHLTSVHTVNDLIASLTNQIMSPRLQTRSQQTWRTNS